MKEYTIYGMVFSVIYYPEVHNAIIFFIFAKNVNFYQEKLFMDNMFNFCW
jgi:hypothetical protein